MKQLSRFASVLLQSLALSAFSLSASAQDTPPAPSPLASEWISLMLPLLLVVAAGIVALWLIKRRYSAVGDNGALRIRSVLAVGPRERIVLIETEKQMLIVGVCASSINTLAQWPMQMRRGDTNP